MNYLLTGENTTRTYFRLLVRSDYFTWLPIFDEQDTGRFLGMKSDGSATEMCDKWFEKAFDRYENGSSGMNVMIHKTKEEFVGQGGLLIQSVNGMKRLEVGYSILPTFWNQGYAKEVASRLRDLAFEKGFDKDFGHSLVSVIHEENIRSIRVALFNGMTLETTFMDGTNKEKFLVYSISRKEWELVSTKK